MGEKHPRPPPVLAHVDESQDPTLEVCRTYIDTFTHTTLSLPLPRTDSLDSNLPTPLVVTFGWAGVDLSRWILFNSFDFYERKVNQWELNWFSFTITASRKQICSSRISNGHRFLLGWSSSMPIWAKLEVIHYNFQENCVNLMLTKNVSVVGETTATSWTFYL